MTIGTADTSKLQQSLYQSEGFKKTHTIKKFFIDNYQGGIYENGKQAVDLVVFGKAIHKHNEF